MIELVAMRGLPGSGKTTRARHIAKETDAVVVGRDFERFQMFGEWWTGRASHEDAVTIALEAKVRALLKAGQSVIVDNTHIKPNYLSRWAKIASESGAQFRVVDVKTPADMCIYRDNERKLRGERHVGPQVISKMAKEIKWTQVKIPDPITVEPYDNPWDLRNAIIVDIDGTLAHMTGRSPYDYSRIREDSVDATVRNLVCKWEQYGNDIIICSGRDEDCRGDTVHWLVDNGIPFHKLLMRPTGPDGRDANGNKLPDWVVKYNLFNENIRDQYHVQFVLDDRNQVVEMWRKLGLKCLQVEPGDF